MELVLSLEGKKVAENDCCGTTARFLRDGELVLPDDFDDKFKQYVPDDISATWMKDGITSFDGKLCKDVMFYLIETMLNFGAHNNSEEYGDVLKHFRQATELVDDSSSPVDFIIQKMTRVMVESVHKDILGNPFGDAFHALIEFISTGPNFFIHVSQGTAQEEVPTDVVEAVDDLFSKLGL